MICKTEQSFWSQSLLFLSISPCSNDKVVGEEKTLTKNFLLRLEVGEDTSPRLDFVGRRDLHQASCKDINFRSKTHHENNADRSIYHCNDNLNRVAVLHRQG